VTGDNNPIVSAAGGSVTAAIVVAVSAVRALWSVHLHGPKSPSAPGGCATDLISISRPLFSTTLERHIASTTAASQPELNLDKLEAELTTRIYDSADGENVDARWFMGLFALEHLLGDVRRPAELRYAVMRQLRSRYGAVLSATLAEAFHLMADVARDLLLKSPDRELELETDLVPPLYEAANAAHSAAGTAAFPRLMLDVCGAIGALVPVGSRGRVRFDPQALQGEYLLNQCFGLPTSIPGFDDLFGGGGLLLADAFQGPAHAGELEPDGVGARLVLTMGPFGSGKSLLSLQMAVEIARKGGVAWLTASEQSVEECRYALQSVGVSVNDPTFTFVSADVDAFPVLSQQTQGSGALIFLPGRALKYPEFIESLRTKLEWLRRYPLRMLIVDPFNAVYPTEDKTPTESRALTVDLLRDAKRAGVNIWMTSEQFGTGDPERRFEENIADTVIRVGVDRNGSPQRFIEVSKSRLQRERSGRHVLTITSNQGIEIHPLPAVYIGEKSLRRDAQELVETNLGIPGLRTVLGRRGVLSGDVVSLHGQIGAYQTVLGMQFLRATDDAQAYSLLVADFTENRMQETVRAAYQQAPEGRSRPVENILLLPIEPGSADPGRILLEIHKILEKHRVLRKPVDRVLIANLSRWELEMPRIVAGDVGFGVALTSLLRRYAVTSLIVCGHLSESNRSSLSDLFLESADVVIDILRVDFRGQEKYYVRALKSHGGTHRRGRFELVVNESGLHIRAKESLVRVDAAGNVHPLRLRMFLHSETLNHRLYNKRLIGALRTALTPFVDVEPQNQRYDPNVLALGSSSGIDELQVLQLDEFQLPYRSSYRDEAFPLYRFGDETAALVADRIPRLRERSIEMSDDQTNSGNGAGRLVAVPFYENMSLLACRYDLLGTRVFPQSWPELVKAYDRWKEQDHPDDELFFACHVSKSDQLESYNCLFLEMLYSQSEPPAGTECDLHSWLTRDWTQTKQAVSWFRTLIRPGHLKMFTPNWRLIKDSEWEKRQVTVTARAAIGRHWYNTLNQTLSELKIEELQQVGVHALYGAKAGSYMTTAGEWYLAVPAYSAAPEVALDVIEYLTGPDKEMQRLNKGIGLPTRSQFYSVPSEAGVDAVGISPYFTMNPKVLRDLVENPFRRSCFDCYQLFAEVLSSHLHRILELPDPSEREEHGEERLDRQMNEVIRSLIASIDFIRHRSMCEACRGRSRNQEALAQLQQQRPH
jgi:KaiC/GvpD/RAD55 family RecA-like ATPase